MVMYSVLFASVITLSLVKAQTFCEEYTNRNVTCFSAPSNCPNSQDCTMTMTAVDNNVTFTITLTGQSDGWVALGISGDDLMGFDDVMMCIYDGSEVLLRHRFNQPNAKNNVAGSDLGDNLVLVDQSYVQGIMSCTFNRTKTIGGGDTQAFDLSSDVWMGLFGIGPAENGEPRIHTEFPWVSDGQINLASGAKIESQRRGGNPTPPTPPPTSPGDPASKTTATSVGSKIYSASVTGIFLLLSVCIMFS